MSHFDLSALVVMGINHRSASLGLRDQLFVEDTAVADHLLALQNNGLRDVMLLSTCDRVEVWAHQSPPEQVSPLVTAHWSQHSGQSTAALSSQIYHYQGAEALRHIFAVAASLDSQVIGEPQVLGQVKAAYRLARDCGATAAGLESVLQAAFACAKRVRSDTAIGEGPVSIAAAAVQAAQDLHGDLSRCRALLIGAGDMGELVAEHFLASGLSWMAVSAPRQSRAEALAESLRINVLPFEDLKDNLPSADILIYAVAGRSLVLNAAQMVSVLKQRRRRPVFVVDVAVPGNVEPAVNRVDGAFLYDLADLEHVAQSGLQKREQASRAAWEKLEQDIAAFMRDHTARLAVPALVALRSQFEICREQVLQECGNDAAAATRMLVNRLLHAPTEEMKHSAAEGAEWHRMEATLRKLFRLDHHEP